MIDWSNCDAVTRKADAPDGEWVFQGTEIPVEVLFEHLRGGGTLSAFEEQYPSVELDLLHSALGYAAQSAWEGGEEDEADDTPESEDAQSEDGVEDEDSEIDIPMLTAALSAALGGAVASQPSSEAALTSAATTEAHPWTCSWIAIRGGEPDGVLSELALNRTNGYTPTPSAEWCCVESDNDWFVLFSGRNSAPEEFSPEFLSVLSKRSELVVSVIEEPIMFSSVAYWVDGRSIWSVVHDAQRGISHIDVRGELPDAVEAIYEEWQARQDEHGEDAAELDYIFQVPIEMAARLTGFRYDRDYPGDPAGRFEVLYASIPVIEPPPPVEKKWWHFLRRVPGIGALLRKVAT